MISRTAVYVAAARAIGARDPELPARYLDIAAEALLGDPAALDVDHPVVGALRLPYDEAMKNAEVVSIVRSMLVRSMARMAQAAREAGASKPPIPQLSPEVMREQQRVMSYQLAEAVVPA